MRLQFTRTLRPTRGESTGPGLSAHLRAPHSCARLEALNLRQLYCADRRRSTTTCRFLSVNIGECRGMSRRSEYVQRSGCL